LGPRYRDSLCLALSWLLPDCHRVRTLGSRYSHARYRCDGRERRDTQQVKFAVVGKECAAEPTFLAFAAERDVDCPLSVGKVEVLVYHASNADRDGNTRTPRRQAT